LPKFVTFNAPNALCGPLLEHCDPITRSLFFLILKKTSPEQLVTIKLRNKGLRGWIN